MLRTAKGIATLKTTFIVLVAAALIVVTAAATAEGKNKDNDDLWSALRGGGHVVLLRHTYAPGNGDPPGFRLDDCSSQRNLSEEGREQARSLGEAFRSRDIPVNRVLTSEWCRCRETAELLELAAVETYPVLNSFFSDRSTAGKQTEALQRFLAEADLQGNLILVTHQVNITELTGIVPSSGEMVVLRLDGRGGYSVRGRLPLEG